MCDCETKNKEECNCDYINIYVCKYCEYTTLDDDPDCEDCEKGSCMYLKQIPCCKVGLRWCKVGGHFVPKNEMWEDFEDCQNCVTEKDCKNLK